MTAIIRTWMNQNVSVHTGVGELERISVTSRMEEASAHAKAIPRLESAATLRAECHFAGVNRFAGEDYRENAIAKAALFGPSGDHRAFDLLALILDDHLDSIA